MQPVVPARQRLDRYEILGELASGGMATVFVARLAGAGGFERMVAIKRLHPHLEKEREFVEMFLDEARIAARIHHPNVVPTLEIGTSERGYYLVMDYVEGTTLARLLSKTVNAGQKIPERIALKIAHDTLAGLHAAHELKAEDGTTLALVHRDVSPQNVLVGMDGTSRITDFGVARAVSRLSSTRAGQLKGKLGYMAPEQARGDEIDRRADVFAVGVILWETLAGKRLFKGKSDTDAETLARVLYGEIASIKTVAPEVSPELAAVISRALERDLSKRFASCADFIDALEHAAAGKIATSREVAKYVDEIVGQEVRERREAIRKLAPPSGPVEDIATVTAPSSLSPANLEAPVSLSSVSSASMSVAEPRSSQSVSHVLFAPPQPGRSMLVLLVGIVAAAIVAAGIAVAVVLALRPSTPLPAPASTTTPPVASAPPAPPSASATAAATTAAPATTSAAPPPPASTVTAPPAGGRTPPPVPTVKPSRGGGDGLSTNPYR